MIRNLPVIVVVNVLLLLINLYLLNWSVHQPDTSDGTAMSKAQEQNNVKNNNMNGEPSSAYGARRANLSVDLPRVGHPLVDLSQDNRNAEDPSETRTTVGNDGLWNEIRKSNKQLSLPSDQPVPKIYQTVFFNKSNPVKKFQHKNWSSLRIGYRVPRLPIVNRINCQNLLSGRKEVIEKTREVMNQREFTKVPIYEETYLEWTQDCEAFKEVRGYVTVPLTQEEEQFPIAFSIAVFTDVEQMERLLRAVYQPQNLYCIHVDAKSSLLIHKTVAAVVNCFDNVFLTSQITKVKWGDISVLLPHLYCMRDLVRYHRGKWKYFIDLAGQEFPLRTNYEMVQILKIYNGSNDLTASHKKMEQDRISFQWAYRWSRTYQQTIFYNTFRKKEPPPFNVTVVKGELHGLFSKRFVEYLVESPEAQEFLRWCWNTGHPTEHYWNTLNYNSHLQAPGGYYGSLDEMEAYAQEPVARVKHWQDVNYVPRECQGKLVRGICVFGVGDLPWLVTRKEMIANKFHLTFEYLALDCLEERHRNRTLNYVGSVSPDFDFDYYRNKPTVRSSRKNGL